MMMTKTEVAEFLRVSTKTVERGVQAINVDEITKLTREERLEVVRNAAKKASKACEAYFKANPLEPEPPMHRKQKAKLEKAKRKAERKRVDLGVSL